MLNYMYETKENNVSVFQSHIYI